MRNLFLLAVIALSSLLLGGCGGSGNSSPDPSPSMEITIPGQSQLETAFPAELPADALQPWETEERSISGIDSGSDFTAGRDWFSSSSNGVSENGEAARIASPLDGSAYGIWRMPLGGSQPGTLSADVNLLDDGTGASSSYYIGLANYGTGRWDWQGPFSDSHVRLSPGEEIAGGGNYLSSVQNTFVCVLVSSGNSVDVVGLGLNPYDGADTAAPAQPAGLTATPVSAGMELQWNAVIASDLAGYRIHYSDQSFVNQDSIGVRQLESLEGSTRALLNELKATTYVRITALDHSGNESPASDLISGTPLTGSAPGLLVTTDLVSGTLGSSANLSAAGADTYDFDTNGDGSFDVTGNTSGTVSVDTSATGIIRPRVRGTSSGGEAVALGAVSLIITGNSRPLASATANPQFGKAPLDVTFTGVAEDAEDDASALTFAWDFDGDGIYEAGTDSLSPTSPAYATPGIYNAKFRVTDSDGASDVDTLSIFVTDPDAPANTPPTASLTVTPDSGSHPLTVTLDASASSDPDGSIVNYEWDFDGDGVYDGYGSGSTTDHTYTTGGVYTAKVRVTDNAGAQDTATDTVDVNYSFTPVAVDTAGSVGFYTSLAVVNGNPAISYYDATNGDLKYVRATDASGTAWDTPVSVDTAGIVGSYTSLAVVDGNPAISYYDQTNGDLKYVRALDSAGIAWSTSVAVDTAGVVGWYTSLTVVDGNPAISYYDSTNTDLKYVRGTDSTGTAWAAPVAVDTAGFVGSHTSLAVVDGNPAISYYDNTNGDLKFVRAMDSSGTAWAAPLAVDTAGFDGFYTSLAVVNGNPAISYYDATNGDLKYVRATDASGTAWDTPLAVDTAGDVGQYTSLAVVDGNPAISYYDLTNVDLKYVRATDSTGTAWAAPLAVDTAGDVGDWSSLAVVNGNPAISYYDSTNGDLKYVRGI